MGLLGIILALFLVIKALFWLERPVLVRKHWSPGGICFSDFRVFKGLIRPLRISTRSPTSMVCGNNRLSLESFALEGARSWNQGP